MSEEEITKMLNCFPQIEVVKYILNLQEENVGLKAVLKGTTHCYDEEEHQRLRNIITEFEKWLEEETEKINDLINPKKGIKPYGEELNILETIRNVYMDCKDKLQELKDGKKLQGE